MENITKTKRDLRKRQLHLNKMVRCKVVIDTTVRCNDVEYGLGAELVLPSNDPLLRCDPPHCMEIGEADELLLLREKEAIAKMTSFADNNLIKIKELEEAKMAEIAKRNELLETLNLEKAKAEIREKELMLRINSLMDAQEEILSNQEKLAKDNLKLQNDNKALKEAKKK